MEKNKTAEKYLTQTVTAKWDIIFGALVAVGVILFLVGWGWGYYFSIPAVFVGAAGSSLRAHSVCPTTTIRGCSIISWLTTG